jgi:hypothetical protein
MCGLADLLGKDLGEAPGTSNGNPHHGRPVAPLSHCDGRLGLRLIPKGWDKGDCWAWEVTSCGQAREVLDRGLYITSRQ